MLHYNCDQQMSESSQQFDCFICSNSSQQKKLIMRALVRRLQKQMNLFDEKSSLMENQQERQGFNQILRIIFGAETSREGSQCRHDKFQRFLLKKLKCSKQALNFACERLGYLLAEKNYHLELIGQQIKHVAESISEEKLESVFAGKPSTQTFKPECQIENWELQKRVTRASKKSLLQSNINLVQSQGKIQVEEQEPLPTFNSLTFLPTNQLSPNLPVSSEIDITAYNFYFAQFPYFFPRTQ